MYQGKCPKCGREVEIEHKYGEYDYRCPSCGHPGFWFEDCLPDYSDCWWAFEWDEISFPSQ